MENEKFIPEGAENWKAPEIVYDTAQRPSESKNESNENDDKKRLLDELRDLETELYNQYDSDHRMKLRINDGISTTWTAIDRNKYPAATLSEIVARLVKDETDLETKVGLQKLQQVIG